MSSDSSVISIKDMTLTYTVYLDRTLSIKELFLNWLHRRKYVDQAKEKFEALSSINLKVGEGERLGIIGRNGAGKSSLLKVIAGILKPSKGVVRVNGNIHPLIEISAGFNPEFSGRENIYLNGYMLGFDRKAIRDKEKEIIEFADLAEFIDVPVKYYSSGMSVRLAFTIATSIEPDILILDEMLAAGDAVFREKAKLRMENMINKARAILIVSHDMDLIKRFSSRTIVIHKGKIIFDGAPESAVQHYLSLPDH